MDARRKLNAAHVTGSLVIATLVAAVTSSWIAFLATAVILIALSTYDGGIRTKPGRR